MVLYQGGIMRTPILNANGIVIGHIEEQGGGKQKAFDNNAMVVGYYEPSTNNTLDANRMVFGKGNQLSALIAQGQ
jgi:hypothetical protein